MSNMENISIGYTFYNMDVATKYDSSNNAYKIL